MAEGSRGYVFKNWAKTFECQPELYFEPTTTDEIKKILESARTKNKKVKVVGNGHSPSDITCTSDFMISMKNYNKILHVNKESKQVTVQAGITLHDFQEQLQEHGLSMSNLPCVSDISLGGAIATGTHGSGAEFGILAASVTEVTLLAGTGELIHCSNEKNKETFDAARCSVGAMGITLELTWQCEDRFNLLSISKAAPLSETLSNMENDMTKTEHYKFSWWPHTESTVVWMVDRTDKPIKPAQESWFWDCFVGYHLLQFAYWVGSFFPWFTKIVNQCDFSLLKSSTVEFVGTSEEVLVFDCFFPQYVTDWAIPREKTAYVVNKLKEWLDESGFYAHKAVEVRFAKKDDILLSPAYGRDTCFINIIMFRPYGKFVPYEDYWNFFEDLALSVGGRPHWAKAHKLGPETLETLYPRFDDFRNICQKLDPDRLFVNDYLERAIFGKE